MVDRLRTLLTNKIHSLPILVLMPHSSCNCRCLMCDIWKANSTKSEISVAQLERHISSFQKLKVREVVLSGGEALMHSNLWRLCELLKDAGIKVTLLSTGLLLKRNADDILKFIDEVIVSLDGSPAIHNQIRNIPMAFEKLEEGVGTLKSKKPGFRITGRTVLQRYNYSDFGNIVLEAKRIGLDQISFLAGDVSTAAFNHLDSLTPERVGEVALSKREAEEFDRIITDSFISLKEFYDSRFIAESPAKMSKIVHYYQAMNGSASFTSPPCNAPWVSAVLESDGRLMPCFFHTPYGNVQDNDFLEVLNSPTAIAFRRDLDVKTNSVCMKCVCSLKLGLTD